MTISLMREISHRSHLKNSHETRLHQKAQTSSRACTLELKQVFTLMWTVVQILGTVKEKEFQQATFSEVH